MEQDIKDRICEQIAEGRSLRAICQDEGMPNKATVFRALAADAEFRDQYARARETQADTLFDEIADIADEECTMVRRSKHQPSSDEPDGEVEVVFDATAVARNRLRVDARKWMAGKLRPKVYGDKIEQTLQGPGGTPLSIAVEWVKASEGQGG
jgi:hypothetical protein